MQKPIYVSTGQFCEKQNTFGLNPCWLLNFVFDDFLPAFVSPSVLQHICGLLPSVNIQNKNEPGHEKISIQVHVNSKALGQPAKSHYLIKGALLHKIHSTASNDSVSGHQRQQTTFWNIFLVFPENGLWHFMQIVSYGDSLHEMSKPNFWG